MVAGEAKKIPVRFCETGEDERAVIAGWTQHSPRIERKHGDITCKLALQRSGAGPHPSRGRAYTRRGRLTRHLLRDELGMAANLPLTFNGTYLCPSTATSPQLTRPLHPRRCPWSRRVQCVAPSSDPPATNPIRTMLPS